MILTLTIHAFLCLQSNPVVAFLEEYGALEAGPEL
jgi:hypothetical protein